MSQLSSRIIATGYYLPERVVTNADLEKVVETTDEWIFTRTGIKERRISAKGETTSDMGAHAARQALERAGLTADQLDLIIVATITPECVFPSAACFIQNKIGATRAAAFDLQAACSGFIYSLVLADNLIRSGTYKNILLIGSEKLSSIVNWQDRNTCVLFGDGAGAVLVQTSHEGGGILSQKLGANGEHHEMLFMKNTLASAEPLTPNPAHIDASFIYMAGKEVFKQAVTAMCQSANDALANAGKTIDDVRCLITHQANNRIIEAVAERLKVPQEKCFTNVHRYGNISAACIPVALREAEEHYRFQRGDLILLVAFGGGLTWGSVLLEW